MRAYNRIHFITDSAARGGEKSFFLESLRKTWSPRRIFRYIKAYGAYLFAHYSFYCEYTSHAFSRSQLMISHNLMKFHATIHHIWKISHTWTSYKINGLFLLFVVDRPYNWMSRIHSCKGTNYYERIKYNTQSFHTWGQCYFSVRSSKRDQMLLCIHILKSNEQEQLSRGLHILLQAHN